MIFQDFTYIKYHKTYIAHKNPHAAMAVTVRQCADSIYSDQTSAI